MTNVINIPAAKSGISSAYDITDRKIDFGKNFKFAVLYPDFYSGRTITRHRSDFSAIKSVKSFKRLGAVFLGRDGYYYDVYNDFGGDILLKNRHYSE